MWRWNSEAYGNTPPDEDPDGNGQAFTLNLRFPGQYFDAESGLHYNWHRYYSPRLGRYISSDPIGLEGGANGYSYAQHNPTTLIDPTGEFAILVPPPIPLFPAKPSPIPTPAWPKWLTPKSALERCEQACDEKYDDDQKFCEAWWKTNGRNPDSYRVCIARARKKYIQCFQDCKKECEE